MSFTTNTTFLGFFSPLIKNVCKPKEPQTISIPCPVNQVQLLMNFLKTGEIKTFDAKSLHTIMSLLAALGIKAKSELILPVKSRKLKIRRIDNDEKPKAFGYVKEHSSSRFESSLKHLRRIKRKKTLKQ